MARSRYAEFYRADSQGIVIKSLCFWKI